jgi:hypothetical protein
MNHVCGFSILPSLPVSVLGLLRQSMSKPDLSLHPQDAERF